MSSTRVIALAAVLMAAGIVVGALASHALRGVLEPRQLESLHTAVHYQLFNALGLMLVGAMMHLGVAKDLGWVAAGLVAGIVCFSGGIYLMLAGAPRALGLVTPLGGLLLIASWLGLAALLWRR
ncbi:MAG: hypothetical protein RL026_819 [Pseudomonadota bacterium]|jgi:uncharacterized membrane protein YgdD (TMEM256/DUF423 family)